MKKGFTLVEMIVVISIIGILAAVIVTGVQQSRAKGRDAVRVADINLLASKIQNYFNENKEYPQALGVLDYVPTDPQTNESYTYIPIDNYYTITATLESPPFKYCVGFDVYGASKCP